MTGHDPLAEALPPTANERRALHSLLRYREPGVSPYRRITPVMRRDLLGWAATLSDEELLNMRNIGTMLLHWIREHQQVQVPSDSTFALVLKQTGWRVELFWNSSAGWFTARLISPWDRNLVPFDDPIGCSGASPEEALANLRETVLEWA